MPRKNLVPGFKELYFDNQGLWVRKIDLGKYHFIELIDWFDATGETDGPGKYCSVLKMVDIFMVDPEAVSSAIASCGDESSLDMLEGEERHQWVAEALSTYGTFAPLGDWYGNNYRKVLDQAREKSKRIRENAHEYDAAMNRAVNRIGTTAEEYMRGNILGRAKRVMEIADSVVVQYARVLEKKLDEQNLEMEDLRRQLEECKKRKPIILPSP